MGKLTHEAAAHRLRAAGITWSSSGNCSDRHKKNCTSFDQINTTTIDGVIWLKKVSRCDIHVTGGTEVNHSPGEHSHWNGYKVDIRMDNYINNFIINSFNEIESIKKNNGALWRRWQDKNGNVYVWETGNKAHWDIMFNSAPIDQGSKCWNCWVWSFGQIVYVEGHDTWAEQPFGPVIDSTVHRFREDSRTNDYLVLYDGSRYKGEGGIYLRLRHGRGEIRKRTGIDSAWRRWHDGYWS